MGNSCGELCHNAKDQREILQIEVTPKGDALEWMKEEQKTAVPLQPVLKYQGDRIIEHYNAEKVEGVAGPRELIQWDDEKPSQASETETPVVEAKMEQNHLIVPHNLVLSRVSNRLQMLLKKELTASPLTEDDGRWYLLDSGNYYSGQLNEGLPAGIGTYLLSNRVYYGETVKGKPEGMGVILNDNFVFKGEFQQGKAEGEATLQSQNLNVKGVFNEGQLTSGKIITKEYMYDGYFLNGKPHGRGFYNNNITKVGYEGDFKQGKFHGEGTYSCAEYVFKGSFENGQREGKGTLEQLVGEERIQKGVWREDRLSRQSGS